MMLMTLRINRLPEGAPFGPLDPTAQQAVFLITGIQASGKSTVAQLLAERLPRSVHVRGDLFRRMVVNGRAAMTPDPSAEALRQLRLRYQLTASVSDRYFAAGFTVIAQDVIWGDILPRWLRKSKAVHCSSSCSPRSRM
jgi:adenylate kinase family enzyme